MWQTIGKNTFVCFREESLEDVLAFLKGLACRKIDAVKCGSVFLDEKIVAAIEDAVEAAKVGVLSPEPIMPGYEYLVSGNWSSQYPAGILRL